MAITSGDMELSLVLEMVQRFSYLRRFPSRFIFKFDQFVLQFTDGSKIWNSILVG